MYFTSSYVFVFSRDTWLLFSSRFYLFLERGREGERGRETSMCGWLSRAPYWVPVPQLICPHLPQAFALTENWTGTHLVHRPVLNPLSHTSQGDTWLLLVEQWTLYIKNMEDIVYVWYCLSPDRIYICICHVTSGNNNTDCLSLILSTQNMNIYDVLKTVAST